MNIIVVIVTGAVSFSTINLTACRSVRHSIYLFSNYWFIYLFTIIPSLFLQSLTLL